ncbi:MAG: Retaining alpha-galactosidase [Bacteroidetes bacterium RBG_13_43_22]|nr:MAG: Retaining alpha-galactosidase [Bacteroidetes bacterium RBG_13_43_22]
MKINHIIPVLALLLSSSLLPAQKIQKFEVKSPDGNIVLNVESGTKLQWSVQRKGEQIIAPSVISLELADGTVLGNNAMIRSSKKTEINTSFNAVNYKKAVVTDHCNQLTLTCKGDYGVIFRVYDDAVAYRFFTSKKGELVIKNEEANFNFTADHKALIPYMWDYRDGEIFNCSFESLYTEQKISEFRKDSLAFLPLLVDAGNGMKAVIIEADLEDYPGMFLDINQTRMGFKGVFAPYPLEYKTVGINYIPTKRADYIAKTSGTRNFPWRAVVISTQDKDLMNVDIVQKLASPPRLTDLSWIEPGQVAWDWWNDMNISHVDFKAGMNTATYKYNIDFASANKIKYIIIDAGWSMPNDLSRSIPAMDIKEIIDYGRQKNVGVILWISWIETFRQMYKVFPLYEQMGVKGLKIDFFDRDDQVAVASTYEIAKLAADHHLLVDYHGIFKPAGIQRTFPNVVGNEGVKGIENVKWAIEDVPRYDVSLPYIRMMAGLMDYTPGAMRNATRRNFRPVNSMPMSQGTRCHQLAMYVIFEVPLQMLSDNATIYMKEQESTDFITSVPTVFDETVPLDGKVGEYAVIARKKGDNWYVAAMTNWTPRELTIDLSFLGTGNYEAVIFKDGINADRDATDYKKEVIKVSSADKLKINLAPGGGWAARIEKL